MDSTAVVMLVLLVWWLIAKLHGQSQYIEQRSVSQNRWQPESVIRAAG